MRIIKLFGLALGVAALNIVVFSPGFMGVSLGGGAMEAATGVTLLLASALALVGGSYVWLLKPAAPVPLKELDTPEDYAEALSRYRRVKALEEDVRLAIEQIERMEKKTETLRGVLGQRFAPGELSYRKFASAAGEVEKLFYLNIRSLLNRLHVFDESELRSIQNPKQARFSRELLQERTNVYNDYIGFVKSSLDSNEEILLKLDKLLLEISRLDSFEPGDIEQMACMQEIDSLIKQTKFYKQ
ncbi:hypothetical protein [Cohnella fermenti]|uniref:5-bromo-4-chloroindolyl phosphate hydrolysis protein n=1 Tax=Cohnella fermenti TaxID=2565925 RepID=A0A4S4C6C6_9BACL|nr:hypothetical protein [Cohnella fermenti]THF83439.1 hypothetical protein E6C55_04550 [Cohnella fermenti]